MSRRSGFTLIEILVVVAILAMLAVLTVSAFSGFAGGSARLRDAARTGQAAFMGAKDRALHAKERRGLRLLRDSSDATLANGFAYVAPVAPQRYGAVSPVNGPPIQVALFDPGTGPQALLVRGVGVDWYALRDFFPFPPRIKIPVTGNGQSYTFTPASVTLVNPATLETTLLLTTPFVGGAIPATDPQATCEIEIGNELLPFHAPIPLPSGIVIDLKRSSPNVQAAWTLPANPDVMYSPRGVIAGPLTAGGPLYFLLRDIGDATANLNPIDPLAKESLILAVVPATGHVQSYPCDPTDADANGTADDLFRFAKLGQRTGN